MISNTYQDETSSTISLDVFMIKLMKSSEVRHQPIVYQLLRFISDYIDSHSSWQRASSDPLQLPIGQATVRARAVHPQIVQAVVAEAASGKLGRSSSVICKNLVRFSYNKGVLKAKTGNKWTDTTTGSEACGR